MTGINEISAMLILKSMASGVEILSSLRRHSVLLMRGSLYAAAEHD
jgi:hypothetical protein